MKAIPIAAACIISAALMTACSHHPNKVDTSASVIDMSQTPKHPFLSKVDASKRSLQIKDVVYGLRLDLDGQSETFLGQVDITFTALDPKRDLRLDFYKGKVKSLTVNGQELTPSYNEYYLIIPSENITNSSNSLSVEFESQFSEDAVGLLRYEDPADNKVYLHSSLQPYGANRIFPCFDQPDLKAKFKLQVSAPSSWHVIANSREISITPAGSKKTWKFAETQNFSTYLFAVHAGPYHLWTDTDFRYPLRLFARHSVAKSVNSKEWLKLTRHGFDFYEKYLGYAYPFKKYDQIISPDMSAGAMESLAAVTFSEKYANPGRPTLEQRRKTARAILHELAHMWFGNLVSLKWWDELWLNESFTTYMADKALSQNLEFGKADRIFSQLKNSSYDEDSLVTSHALTRPVKDTLEAESSFDHLTYSKGAALLKQLEWMVGEEKLQESFRSFVKIKAFENAVSEDFFKILSTSAQKDFTPWRKLWLESAGVNSLMAEWSCEDSKIDTFYILQSPSTNDKVVREHQISIALISGEKKLTTSSVIKASIKKTKESVPDALGRPCPRVVYPNYGDKAYAKVILDSKSLEALSKDIYKVQEPFLRQLIWGSLWQMVQDAKLDVTEFSRLALINGLQKETDLVLIEQLLDNLAHDQALFLYPKDTESEQILYNRFVVQLEDYIWYRMHRVPRGSQRQTSYFNFYISNGQSFRTQNRLADLLNGRIRVPGQRLDQNRRWTTIIQLSRSNYPGIENFISAEQRKDRSRLGRISHMAASAALPDWQTKTEWINKLQSKHDQLSTLELRTLTKYLFPVNQPGFRRQYGESFFGDLEALLKTHSDFELASFSRLAPFECSAESHPGYKAFLNRNLNSWPLLEKNLKRMEHESLLCGMVRDRARSGAALSLKF